MISLSPSDVADLIPSALQGDKQAMHSVFVAAQEFSLYRLRGMLRSSEDLEEVLQNTMLRVFRHLADFDRSRSNFSTWVNMLSSSCALDYLRRQKKRKRVFFVPIEEYSAVASLDPSKRMEVEEDANQGVSLLSDDEREVCEMVARDIPQRLVGEAIGMPRGTVATTLKRVRTRNSRWLASEKE